MAQVTCCAQDDDPFRSSSASCRRWGAKMAKVVANTVIWTLQVVKRSDAHRFVVLPKRWIFERTFAWISRNRRLARDFERYARTVAAFFRLAMIRIMLRRLTRPSHSA